VEETYAFIKERDATYKKHKPSSTDDTGMDKDELEHSGIV
jgi:hypothetical protein